jgi:hypothetical protein
MLRSAPAASSSRTKSTAQTAAAVYSGVLPRLFLVFRLLLQYVLALASAVLSHRPWHLAAVHTLQDCHVELTAAALCSPRL